MHESICHRGGVNTQYAWTKVHSNTLTAALARQGHCRSQLFTSTASGSRTFTDTGFRQAILCSTRLSIFFSTHLSKAFEKNAHVDARAHREFWFTYKTRCGEKGRVMPIGMSSVHIFGWVRARGCLLGRGGGGLERVQKRDGAVHVTILHLGCSWKPDTMKPQGLNKDRTQRQFQWIDRKTLRSTFKKAERFVNCKRSKGR